MTPSQRDIIGYLSTRRREKQCEYMELLAPLALLYDMTHVLCMYVFWHSLRPLIFSFLLLSNLIIIILYYYGQLGSDGSRGKMDGVPLTCQSRRGDGVSASVRLGKRTVWRHIICPKTAVSVRGHMLRIVAVVGCLLHVSATSSSSLLAAQPASPPLDSTRLGLNLRGIAGIIVTTFLPHALLFFVLCFQFIIVVEDRSWREVFTSKCCTHICPQS